MRIVRAWTQAGLILIFGLVWLEPSGAQPFWPSLPPAVAVPQTPQSQRNALNNLRSQVNWLQNTIRNASGYSTGGFEMIWQQFQVVRGSFNTFKMTLNSRQLTYGANEIAELDSGLEIIQEAFTYYQSDVAAGRPARIALADMCQVLREATDLWLQQLNKDSAKLKAGW